MFYKKKSLARKLPSFIVAGLLAISGILKIAGIHPMRDHFKLMGFDPVVIMFLGSAEIIFSALFLFTPTNKIGLLLLTGYFGGAMAAEIPFHQSAAPMGPLVLVWLAAFLREPSAFFPAKFYEKPTNPQTLQQ